MKKSDKKYPSKRDTQLEKRQITLFALISVLVLIGGGIFAFSTGVFAKPSNNDVNSDFAVFANPNNPECPYNTPLINAPIESRSETTLKLDLSDEKTKHYVTLVVPSSELALLTDGSIKQAGDFEVGNAMYMTGEKIGVVQSVEHEIYTPKPVETDGKGNVYSRVIGKSERYVETMLYLYTKDDVVKTTPEHPFYVDGKWVEAQYLKSGDKIRSQTGATIEVVRTETLHDPQFVYSLLVEGTHNFYVGKDGLLAHNCTPTIKTGLDKIIAKFPRESMKCDKCASQIYDLFTSEGFPAKIGRMESRYDFITLADGSRVSENGFHEFVQVGDTVYDAITGSSGMRLSDYKNLFYDGVFDDGTLRLFYK